MIIVLERGIQRRDIHQREEDFMNMETEDGVLLLQSKEQNIKSQQRLDKAGQDSSLEPLEEGQLS